jgi:hypothetical protein
MNRGYALGFLLVLLVVILGLYVALTGFQASREVLRAQPTAVRATRLAQATPAAPAVTPSAGENDSAAATEPLTATVALPLTPTIEVAATLIVAEPTLAVEAPAPTAVPAATTAPAEPANTPEAPLPPPTPAPAAGYAFQLAGPHAADPNYPHCCYIYGTVRDAAGNGLEGIRVEAANEWTAPFTAETKGGSELGQYDIPINTAIAKWYIKLLDAAGNQISSEVQVQFDGSGANGYRVDWRRTN